MMSGLEDLCQFGFNEFQLVMLDHDIEDRVHDGVVAVSKETATHGGRCVTGGHVTDRCIRGVDGRQYLMLDVVSEQSDVVMMS